MKHTASDNNQATFPCVCECHKHSFDVILVLMFHMRNCKRDGRASIPTAEFTIYNIYKIPLCHVSLC